MELGEAVRQRRMVRRYSSEPVPREVLDRLLSVALRAPSAGFSQGVDLLVLEGATQTRPFFEASSDPEFLAEPGAMRGLLEAPVIVVPIGDPGVYVARYAEADKAQSSLAGLPAEAWPTPYWLVDASFVVMLLLLAATEEGLGALFFRLHRDPGGLLASFGAPDRGQLIGAVALGYEAAPGSGGEGVGVGQAGQGQRRERRARRPMEDVVHRGRW